MLWPQDVAALVSRKGDPPLLACLLCAPWDSAPDRRWSMTEMTAGGKQVSSLWKTTDGMEIQRSSNMLGYF